MPTIGLPSSGEELLLRLILSLVPQKSGMALFRGNVGHGHRFWNDERMLWFDGLTSSGSFRN